SASDSRRRVDNLLFNRLAHKNADRFQHNFNQRLPSNRAGAFFSSRGKPAGFLDDSGARLRRAVLH
ncbi:hypothetical protein, partial [Burkholderia sp. SIMBA_062]|uniref:hypothetical protein n=1 Tax=Burkholderia sp. SIMBA_062 TaxID=3085803 RepID=UPI00397DEF38